MIPEDRRDRAALRMRGVTKTFGAVKANDGIDLEVRGGEVLGLLGENGAGKSTLMNILYGLLRPDSGTVEIDGTPVDIAGPASALARGIGMVHQHFMLIPAFTVMENLVLGAEPAHAGILDRARGRASVVEISERFGLEVDPDAKIAALGVAARQRVEILRALYRGARILILDEPTAVLTPAESDRLFQVVGGMAREGMSVILISHKLHELLAVTERITVIRDGRVVRTVDTAATTQGELARLMVGRETELELTVAPRARSESPMLTLRGVSDRAGRVRDVDLAVHGGEIVGIAGMDGSGQTELAEMISGVRPVGAGSIALAGADVTRAGVRDRLEAGLGYVPEDRSNEGLVLDLPLYENAVLRRHRHRGLRVRGLLSRRAMRAVARRLIEGNDVRPPHVDQTAASLSGGNQQKLLVGRELADDPQVLVVSQPTRGVDVMAGHAVHRRLLDARDRGRAVLLISLDLDEIKALSDRIVVMSGGRVAGELARGEAADESLGLLMAGAGSRVTTTTGDGS
ncbi:sugar ABC transporter [Acrocarpospora corrugata]|uniref:Sugar ABC transporter n=1 Tax=Acrocarpospora corrugata TaxID=35763 RepID=A0A5M3W8B0_9ACTN|nr:ABC transporter ATP-binding protein [Acrocarpospora corrugata]GES04480.1 sugar ABC transporter [Acrocarpospora corrugata]